MAHMRDSLHNDYDNDWLPVPATPDHYSAYASPPPERHELKSSYVPPFARGDRYRPGYSNDQRDNDISPSLSPEKQRKGNGDLIRDAPNGPKERNKASGRVMPKDFQTPLTCFYWANQGHCSKSDDDCWYAHHWTGVVAAAPVRVGQGNAVAGRVAERIVDQATLREQTIQEREAGIIARERDVTINEDAIEKSAANLKADIQKVFTDLDTIGNANADACMALSKSRDMIMAINDLSDASCQFATAGHHLLDAVNTAIESLVNLQDRLEDIEKHMNTNVGNCEMEELVVEEQEEGFDRP